MAKKQKMSKANEQVSLPDSACTALYVRVSTDAQAEEGHSIEAQKEMLVNYCKAYHFTNYEFFVDAGFSGAMIERPGISSMIADIRSGRIRRVIIYKLDRLSRSQKDTMYLIEDVFNPHDVVFISLQEQLNTRTPTGRLIIGILASFAQLERDFIRERTSMGMRKRVQQGQWPGGGHLPFGYAYDKAQGILVPNDKSAIVTQCFSMYLQGHSADEIALALGFKYDVQVRNILTRKTYLGLIEYNDQLYQGQHTALIDQSSFDRVQWMISDRAATRRIRSEFLLTGLIECGECGAKMRYQKWGMAGYKMYCYSKQKSKRYLIRDPDCPSLHYWADEIEDAVIQTIKTRSFDRSNDHATIAQTSPIDAIKEQIHLESGKLKRLYSLYADGDDTLVGVLDEKRALLTRLRHRLDQAQNDDDAHKKTAIRHERVHHLLGVWDALLPQDQRKLIVSIIEKVVIRQNDIQVHFKL